MSTCTAPAESLLRIDPAAACTQIQGAIRDIVGRQLRRKGVVIGLSGGVDSTTAAALAVRALGRERVLGLLMPERESSAESLRLGRLAADWLDIRAVVEDIGPILQAAGCYRRRDEAIRSLIPDYGEGYRCKIVTSSVTSGAAYPIFWIVVQAPDGAVRKARLPADVYWAVVAATNFKQRTRKMLEYYYADRYSYAVLGTPNRLEYDQGFFVKNGDGAADLKPIAHLYKTQVYALARYLGVPREIYARRPDTDTYSLPQSQEEFFFALPVDQMDVCLYARDHGLDPDQVCRILPLRREQVERVFRMIDSRRRAARYLHCEPLLACREQQ